MGRVGRVGQVGRVRGLRRLGGLGGLGQIFWLYMAVYGKVFVILRGGILIIRDFMSFEKTIIYFIVKFTYNNWVHILDSLIALGIGWWGYLLTIDSPIYFGKISIQKYIIISLLLLGLIIWSIVIKGKRNKKNIELEEKRNKRNVELEEKIKEKDEENAILSEKIQLLENKTQEIHNSYYEIFDIYLSSLFLKLKLNDNDRISLYKYEEEDENFLIIGRYASNPSYNKRNRNLYTKEGLIAKAWDNGEVFIIDGIPDYKETMKPKEKKKYFKHIKTICTISDETLRQITMKSRSFYMRAFNNISGIHRSSIIVIESINERAFEKDKLNIIIEEEEKRLIAFIEKMNWKLPKLSNAKKLDF